MRAHLWIGLGLFSAVACSEYKLGGALDAAGTDSGDARDPYGDGDDDPDDPDGDDETSSVSGRVCDPSGGDWIVGAYVWVAVDDDGDGITWQVGLSDDMEGDWALNYFKVSATKLTFIAQNEIFSWI